MPRTAIFALLVAASELSPASSLAADGAYGRLDADAAIQGDVGVVTQGAGVGPGGTLALRYLQSAGVYGSLFILPSDALPRSWTCSAGVEVRPLFLPRFFGDMERGPAALDLTLDSIALRLGVVEGSDETFFRGGPGFEAGLDLSLPLSQRASGPWLSASAMMRWSLLGTAGSHAEVDQALLWTFTLGWQQLFRLGIADLADANP